MAVLVTAFGPASGSEAFEYGVELALVADTGVDILCVLPARSPTSAASVALADRADETALVDDVTVRVGDPTDLVPARVAATDAEAVVLERGRSIERARLRRLVDRLSVPTVVVPAESESPRVDQDPTLRCP